MQPLCVSRRLVKEVASVAKKCDTSMPLTSMLRVICFTTSITRSILVAIHVPLALRKNTALLSLVSDVAGFVVAVSGRVYVFAGCNSRCDGSFCVVVPFFVDIFRRARPGLAGTKASWVQEPQLQL